MTSPGSRNSVVPAARSITTWAALDDWTGVALLIDARAAALVAANAAGQALYPALGTSQALPLDGAMPALRTLRAIMQAGPLPTEAVPLVFWTARGVQTMSAQVVRSESAELRHLLLVKSVADFEMPRETIPARVAAHVSDEETLREIAMQIHEGQRRLMTLSDQARNAQDAAQPSESMRSEYPRGLDLAKLAHELKTPVSAIAAASEVMRDGRFGKIGNKRYAGYITDIHESARHALDLIERMLNRRSDVPSIQSQEFRFEDIRLDDLADSCISTMRTLAAAKGLSLLTKSNSTPAIVTADAIALKQILLNLITNAIKFTPSGGTILVGTVGSGPGAVTLTVEDTGLGMTAAVIAEALNPNSLDLIHKREGGGWGLGLPMSQSLAEAMGAQLVIDSTPGEGTRVTLTFPGEPSIAK